MTPSECDLYPILDERSVWYTCVINQSRLARPLNTLLPERPVSSVGRASDF